MLLPAVIGISLGLLIIFGPLNFLNGPVESLNELLVSTSSTGLNHVMSLGGETVTDHPVSIVLRVFLSTMLPGMIALILVKAARAAINLRRMIASIFLIIALSSFIYLPASQAIMLTIFAFIASFVLSAGKGLLLTAPLFTMATLLGLKYGVLLWSGALPALGRGAIELASFSGPDSLVIWKFVLIVAGFIPFVFAAGLALNDEIKSKKQNH